MANERRVDLGQGWVMVVKYVIQEGSEPETFSITYEKKNSPDSAWVLASFAVGRS